MHHKYSEVSCAHMRKRLAATGRLRRDRGVAGIGRAGAAARRRASRRARRSRAGVPGPGDRLLQWRQERPGGRAGPGQRGRRYLAPIRLTYLPARAQLSLATTSELVSDRQWLGYLERRTDGTDRRTKLILPRRRQALADADDGSPRSSSTGRRSSDRSASPPPASPCRTCWTRSPAATTERKRANHPPPRARLRLSWPASRAAQRARTPPNPLRTQPVPARPRKRDRTS
jgi:hypothetical protein